MQPPAELDAAVLQAIVTMGTAAFCWYLFARYRHRYFLWWAAAWTFYVLRIGAIIAFLITRQEWWLFTHQILTGWTALVLLWAALTFSRSTEWRSWYTVALAFPVVWSYLAIYQMESFMLAAVPAVLFLSIATFTTSWVFLQQYKRSAARGAAVLAAVLGLWGLHHLDYPLLRAQGAWNPWGYYLDILFVLATGIGIVMLGLEELDRANSTVALRTSQLEQLSTRIVQQHEDERRRVSLELHDQTAQVWAAVKMQLGLLREGSPPELSPRFDRTLDLVDTGIQSIRSVTTNLRPPLLDDLGLGPALRALVDTFAAQSDLDVQLHLPAEMPAVEPDAALALFRAVQEALSNVARHSSAESAEVRLSARGGQLTLTISDDGKGFPDASTAAANATRASLGLTGMRERIAALHGSVTFTTNEGALVTVTIPLN
ncbi:MAG: sensor histidine kinase, partial [Gemmatimonadota bacterium]|nr:sensor histidine kinase [Gemmatimonadota bacterium]